MEVDSRLRRGFEEVIPDEGLEGSNLRVKFGADPTGAELHLGHLVILNKLRQFQEAGHTVVFIIGDYTARIGDPSGRDETRPSLDPETVEEHASTYTDQVFTVLDRDATDLCYNAEWLESLGTEGVLDLAARTTVARMLEREDFQNRYESNQPIRLHEFLYPLLQGWDSVQVGSDLEIGGTDQKFNLLVGRKLQREEGQEPQAVGTLPILPGTDGSRKMSKSYGNHIPLTAEPREMYGQLMAVPDTHIVPYLRLLTDVSDEELEATKEALEGAMDNPKEHKKRMARSVVTRVYDQESAKEAESYFERTVEQEEQPDDQEMDQVRVPAGEHWIVDLVDETGILDSRGEIKRMLNQGGIYLDGDRLEGLDHDVGVNDPRVIRVGSHRHCRVVPDDE